VLQNAALGDFRYTDGDYPIVVLQPDTAIRCGIQDDDVKEEHDSDRRRGEGDDCQFIGGFMQVSMVGYVESYFDMDGVQGQDRVNLQVAGEILSRQVVTLTNITIEGMTFTGDIEAVNNLPGSSVIMAQPGNVQFVNCQWTDMTAPSGTSVVCLVVSWYCSTVYIPSSVTSLSDSCRLTCNRRHFNV
jgi:hypothetical protein